MTTTPRIVLSVLLLAPAMLAGQSDWSESGSVERAFAPGGLVDLNLSAGDYTVRGGATEKIQVTWHTRTVEQAKDVRVRAVVRRAEATITTDGPANSFRVEIDVPGRSDLFLRMTAGDLTITGITGHKDVRLRAGDLSIEVPHPTEYRHVTASVMAGDLSAAPFGVEKGGLFRSFTHEGQGEFDLRARLWAGDLRLKATGPPRE